MQDLEKMYSELGFRIEKNDECVHIGFGSPRTVLSTGIVNGGFIVADHIVHLKVPRYSIPYQPPEEAVENYCELSEWSGKVVGMVTSASMDSICVRHSEQQSVNLTALATASVYQPMTVGDKSGYRIMTHQKIDPGTINISVITSAKLSSAAMVEAIMICTEAKAAALQQLVMKSSQSGHMATGTATDGIAIAVGAGPEEIRHCGKNTLFGEILGGLVIEVVKEAVRWDILKHPRHESSEVL